jgi:hypothetical protein
MSWTQWNGSYSSHASRALLEWVRATIAVASGQQQESLPTGLRGCFVDGARALCIVVQHYEPGLLPAEALSRFPSAVENTNEWEIGVFAVLNAAATALGG